MTFQLGLFDDDEAAAPPPAGPLAGAPVPEELAEVAARVPSSARLGTSSWTFPGWAGIVFDRTASDVELARSGLAAYACHPLLRTVGLDRTWYRSVSAPEFAGWAAVVPDDFRFLVKADRLLTSPSDPADPSFRRANPRFLDPAWAMDHVVGPAVEGLRSKAGPLVFQFSPFSPGVVGGADRFVERLHAFLDALPRGPLYAVELRTPAFLTATYAKALEATAVSHCYTVHPAMASLEEQLRMVRPFEQPALVVRWMLHAGLAYEGARSRYEPFDRLVDPDEPTLERIAVAVLDGVLAEREAFVIVNNKAEGSAPLSVFRLARRIAHWEGGPPSR